MVHRRRSSKYTHSLLPIGRRCARRDPRGNVRTTSDGRPRNAARIFLQEVGGTQRACEPARRSAAAPRNQPHATARRGALLERPKSGLPNLDPSPSFLIGQHFSACQGIHPASRRRRCRASSLSSAERHTGDRAWRARQPLPVRLVHKPSLGSVRGAQIRRYVPDVRRTSRGRAARSERSGGSRKVSAARKCPPRLGNDFPLGHPEDVAIAERLLDFQTRQSFLYNTIAKHNCAADVVLHTLGHHNGFW